MIAAIPARKFVLRQLGRTSKPELSDHRAVAEDVRCLTRKTIHGLREDYRAAAGIDLIHNETDHKADSRIGAPLLTLWGNRSLLPTWLEEVESVSGGAIDSGHFLVEKAPLAVLAAFDRFFV